MLATCVFNPVSRLQMLISCEGFDGCERNQGRNVEDGKSSPGGRGTPCAKKKVVMLLSHSPLRYPLNYCSEIFECCRYGGDSFVQRISVVSPVNNHIIRFYKTRPRQAASDDEPSPLLPAQNALGTIRHPVDEKKVALFLSDNPEC